MKQVVPCLPTKFIPYNIVVFGEVWKPLIRSQWLDSIDDCDIGNFTNVKLGEWPLFGKNLLKDGDTERTVIFGQDIISELHPAPNCKNINEQQCKNFYTKCSISNRNQIYYYAFNNVTNWKTEGGCVVLPQCTNENCDKYGCSEHLDVSKEPSAFGVLHLCECDFKNKVCLLSHRQMIVNSFLKTKSIKHVTQLQCIDDEFMLKNLKVIDGSVI